MHWTTPGKCPSTIARSTPILRLKALAALVIIAVPQIGSLVLASLVQNLGLPAIGNAAIIAGTVVMNMAVIATMYKFLTSYATTWRGVLTGAVFAGAIFTILQSIGPWFVKRQAMAAQPCRSPRST